MEKVTKIIEYLSVINQFIFNRQAVVNLNKEKLSTFKISKQEILCLFNELVFRLFSPLCF